MSSRKLLVLLDGLPHDSWFKLAVNRDWEEYKAKAEAAASRAVQDRIKSQLFRKAV